MKTFDGDWEPGPRWVIMAYGVVWGVVGGLVWWIIS